MTESQDFDVEIREILSGNGVFEAHRLVGEYKCYRRRKDDEVQELLVRIYDAGPSNENARYHWEVSVPDAEVSDPVNANAGSSIFMAGHLPHWNMLDTEARREKN